MRVGSRLLLEAALRQQYEKEKALDEFYRCDLSKFPRDLSDLFVELKADTETVAFLEESKRKASNICLQLFYTLVYVILGLFLSQTAINGLLERGKMFVFSQAQLTTLLPSEDIVSAVLDIGAGDGNVTEKFRQALELPTVHVTELSVVMQRVLRKKGFKVLDAERWTLEGGQQYDLISCLNVLDRCSKPLTMLKQITNSLKPGGVFVLALVLPYEPFVENHSMQATPAERLPISSDDETWEGGVESLWSKVVKPLGYSLVSFSRVPYLCEGDLNANYYALDNVVLIMKRIIS